jgi:hypothetical protein
LARYEKLMHRKADLSLFITEEDRQYAISNFKLDESKTMVVPFAVELRSPPSLQEKQQAKERICSNIILIRMQNYYCLQVCSLIHRM